MTLSFLTFFFHLLSFNLWRLSDISLLVYIAAFLLEGWVLISQDKQICSGSQPLQKAAFHYITIMTVTVKTISCI